MSIRVLMAAATVAVGVGQAEAATVLDVEFTITKAVIEYSPSEGPDEGFDDIHLDEFWGVKVGETVNAVFTYTEEWVGERKSLNASFSIADQLLFRGTLSQGMPWQMAWFGISGHTPSPEFLRYGQKLVTPDQAAA